MKLKPFEKTTDGTWSAKFGRLEVEVRHEVSGSYWRGPDRELVLERPRDRYPFAVKGVMSGAAYTLEAAFERAEAACLSELKDERLKPRYFMTDEQRQVESAAITEIHLDTIEADRIAHSRGWPGVIDVIPGLKRFAEAEGLFPFDAAPRP